MNTKESANKKRIEILKTYVRFVSKNKRWPTRKDLVACGISRDSVRYQFVTMDFLKESALEYSPQLSKMVVEEVKTDTKAIIMAKVVSLIAEYLRWPTKLELHNAGITNNLIKHHFMSYNNLKMVMIETHEGLEEHLLANDNEDFHPLSNFTKESIGSVVKEHNLKNGIYFVTAVAPVTHLDYTPEEIERHQYSEGEDFIIGSNLHKPGFAAIENFRRRTGAGLVLLPMPAHIKALKKQPQHYDPALENYRDNFATEFTFNVHLKALEAYINPQQINPLTGLKRLRLHRYKDNMQPGRLIKRFKTSIIVGHAKQMMEVAATGNSTHPRLIHSTGTITKPSYLRNRIGMIAQEDHKLGGLIVEIENDRFWIRQAQMDPMDGSFVDWGTRYHADGSITKERAEAFKMGDIHPGYEDQAALQCWYDLWEDIKPKRIYYEDFFDGKSVTHHLEKKKLARARLRPIFKSLENEIEEAKRVLGETFKKAPTDAKLYATASNHPEHLSRYLDEGRYINDDVNYAIAHRMIVLELDGKNALREYLDPKKQMIWTHVNDDHFIEGVQLNSHGHLGLNGARPGKRSQEEVFGDAMVAHSHTPGIFHNLFVVGHSTVARHGYNDGASTWILCSGAVYKRGQKQLYMVIGGKARPSRPLLIDSSPIKGKQKRKA